MLLHGSKMIISLKNYDDITRNFLREIAAKKKKPRFGHRMISNEVTQT